MWLFYQMVCTFLVLVNIDLNKLYTSFYSMYESLAPHTIGRNISHQNWLNLTEKISEYIVICLFPKKLWYDFRYVLPNRHFFSSFIFIKKWYGKIIEKKESSWQPCRQYIAQISKATYDQSQMISSREKVCRASFVGFISMKLKGNKL